MATLYDESDIEDIIMKCPDEEVTYDKPSKMYDSNGKRLYAYVTLIMLGDSYIPAALVLAKSVRDCGSEADLVVMVTPDISDNGKKALSMFFDKVIEINYVKVKNWRTIKQTTREYLNLVFTKFHVFNLLEYKKVILIDADALVLKHPDHLFTMNTPAGCYLENKSHIITYDSKGNYVLPDSKKLQWYDEMCECCGHGKLIDKSATDKIKSNYRNSGIGGGLMVLEPKVGELDDIILDVSRGYSRFLVERKLIWPEQQYLTLRYSGKWHGINPRFFGLQGYPHWKVLYGLQYGGDKPFLIKSKLDIKERLQYPDYKLWHEMYSVILQTHPWLKDIDTFAESIKMNALFAGKRDMSRTISVSKNVNDNKISKIYDVSDHKIKNKHLQYYHTKNSTCYIPNYVRSMFPNVDDFDYYYPIKQLAKYTDNGSYYKKIENTYSINKTKKRLDEYENINEIDRDLIMLEYVKCKPHMFVITIWPLGEQHTKKLIEKLSNDGNVYYVKKVSLTKNGIKSLMFNMYDEFTFGERSKFINNKLEYIGCKDTEKNNVTFVFFDNNKKKKISGQASPYKKEIRNLMLNQIGDKNLRGNDIIHVNDYFYQTIEYSQMILNDNSLKFLNAQHIDRFSSDEFSKSNNMLQTFRNWIYNNVSQLDINRLIVIGGFILYMLGIRNSQDIDGLFIPTNNNNKEEQAFIQKVFENLQNKGSKIFFADVGVEGSQYWRDKWTEKNMKVLEQFDIKNTTELATNPRYHMYIQGIKFYLPEHEIVRKIIRNRPQDHIDFIMINMIKPSLLNDLVSFDNGKINYNDKIKYIDDNDIKYNNEDILKSKYFKNDIRRARDTLEFKEYFKK